MERHEGGWERGGTGDILYVARSLWDGMRNGTEWVGMERCGMEQGEAGYRPCNLYKVETERGEVGRERY